MESCSTCATLLPLQHSISLEKTPEDRTVSCCGRIVCGECIERNSRFAEYCPYCQISNTPTSLPQRLRDPPSYRLVPLSKTNTTGYSIAPPPYTLAGEDASNPRGSRMQGFEGNEKGMVDDTLHFLNHDHDSITSLSFRYGVPAAALRQANNITSDHLLLGRRTVSIPGRYYKGGVSLSPRPIDGEDEEIRKSKIRRFMTSCKVSDYDIAVLYLEQSDYDLGSSVEAYLGDEAWERQHPQEGSAKAPSKLRNRGLFWLGLST
ncbi:hypothetical protein EsDP_00003189 [Epichloe bromicola]|uniref:LysM domain-containing protein n=1 Tax=Epichloe bromicola TaxID=79588 RepID=A0ABQ0CN02_9HYPO